MLFYIFCFFIDEFFGPEEEDIITLEQELLEESRDRDLSHADITRIISARIN
jgi:hypothetical protein